MKHVTAAFTHGRFGSGQRLSTSGFVVFGLLTFWVYSVLRFRRALEGHVARRWSELEPMLAEAPAAERTAIRSRGFRLSAKAPLIAAILFGVDGVMVLYWFGLWIVVGSEWNDQRVLTLALASAVFFAATCITMLWAAFAMKAHETTELLLRTQGPAAASPGALELGDDLVTRWERQVNRISLFLVIAVPLVFSPAIGFHLVIAGQLGTWDYLAPLACFVFAAVFHIWGTTLLVALYNDHLQAESRFTSAPAATQPEVPGSGGAEPTRELAAIMLTDIHGYSKAMERDEARAYARLIEHNQILRAAISAHRGREIKTIGDSFLVIFKSALDAVDCALQVQRSLKDFNDGRTDEDRVVVRIGIHLGDVLVTENDVYGDGVNVAARIEPLAEPGGICVSEPVFEMVRKKIHLDVQRIEGAQLKNISVAPGLYRIRLAEDAPVK